MIVYKITNDINDKIYIGITTKELNVRWERHLAKCRRGENTHLYLAMRKYGIDKFHIQPIDYAETIEELKEKESYYIKLYNTETKGYNMTGGGDINPMENLDTKNKHNKKMESSEVRKKISESMKKYRAENGFSEEHRKKISEANTGRICIYNNDLKIKKYIYNPELQQYLNDGWIIISKENKNTDLIFATRSVGCYCILENGERFDFDSYKDAGIWWYNTFNPFNDSYSEATFMRKIKNSIDNKPIKYRLHGKNLITITNIKWFKKEGDA